MPVSLPPAPAHLDPLGPAWEQEFQQAHGRAPTDEDRSIRLFSLAYPDEWRSLYEAAYGVGGSPQEAIRAIYPQAGQRTWDSLPAALSRLSEHYTDQDALAQDIGTLYAGLSPRNGRPFPYRSSLGAAVVGAQEMPNVHLAPTGQPFGGDVDANVHHWAWALALAQRVGPASAALANSLRETTQGQGPADVLAGDYAAEAARALRKLKGRAVRWAIGPRGTPMPISSYGSAPMPAPPPPPFGTERDIYG